MVWAVLGYYKCQTMGRFLSYHGTVANRSRIGVSGLFLGYAAAA